MSKKRVVKIGLNRRRKWDFFFKLPFLIGLLFSSLVGQTNAWYEWQSMWLLLYCVCDVNVWFFLFLLIFFFFFWMLENNEKRCTANVLIYLVYIVCLPLSTNNNVNAWWKIKSEKKNGEKIDSNWRMKQSIRPLYKLWFMSLFWLASQ